MRDSESLLQERLEWLAAGKSLKVCLADLPEDEADLVRMAAMLCEVQYPERNRDAVAAQRANLLRLAAKEVTVQTKPSLKTGNASTRARPKWVTPLAVFSGAAALLFVCALVALAGAGLVWQLSRGGEVAQIPSPTPTAVGVARFPSPSPTTVDVTPSPLPSPTPASVVQRPAASPTLTLEASPIQEPTFESALDSTYDAFLPLVASPLHPQKAVLKEAQGLVQVQADDGTWTTASAGGLVTAGQRVRTGALSSARLVFCDGSQARLGPDTEVSVDELDARASGGPRIVVLTQWVGETDHDVAPADDAGSRYEVRTPSGVGEAKGTSFHVLVTLTHLTRFSVDKGAVAVTGLNVTVVVVAGQLTTISPEQPPDEPVFRITGEGEVTQTGDTWTVAGQTFETDDGTVIVGNPQAGDWVSVEGHLLPDGTRVADRIVLLRRSPENRFTLTGRVDVISGTTWTVAGQVVMVNDETRVDEGIESGDLVRVEGVILKGGSLLAEYIRLLEEAPGLPFDFVGVVQDVADEEWKVSGVAIAVDASTKISEGLASGDVVQVRGWILDDGTWLARSIERVKEEGAEFEFTGYVESINPWVVSGIAFETTEWTEIETGIELGDRVRVEGRIRKDGTWVAAEIERLGDDKEALHIVFVGTVTRQDPWVVSGFPLVVDDETVVEDGIEVGDLVTVKAWILPDGTWLAKEIRRVDVEPGLGCFSVSAVVVSVSSDQIVLDNWPAVDLDLDGGVEIEGEVDVDCVILILVCVDADGRANIVAIIVIYQPSPVIVPPPSPPSPPPPPPPPEDTGGKVTICHRPPGNPDAAHTITIDRAALQEHLSHGDTLGPCPDHDDDDHDDDGD